MNTLPSDTNESIVDIFVLCGSSSVALPLKVSLEEGGYRVTLFTDGTQLLETLRAGIPNLLICDATTDDTAGYDACRQIKADDNLWMIPVLILSRTRGLSDLLSVLDCNADNFIPYPCEPPFLISLIEGMLVTPVERQTPEMVKTQFRIQHDEKVYVVTADRRKLLELLLSSFETAVSISSDHSQARDEAYQLSREGAELRDKLSKQVHISEELKESLRLKELNEKKLLGGLESREQELEAKTAAMDRLQKDLDDDRALIAAAEDHIRTMLQQKEEMTASHAAETTSNEQQVSRLSSELAIKGTEVDRLTRELEFQATRCAGYESTLGEVLPQKEAAENALRSLTTEAEQLRAALGEEKSRAALVTAELEKAQNSLARSEQDYSREIASLKETITLKQSALDQLKSELGVETKRAITAYESFTTLQSEKEKSESSLRAGVESLRQQLADITTELDSTSQALKEEERARVSAEAGFAEAANDKERLGEQVREITAALAETRSTAESGEKQRQAIEENYRNATRSLDEIRAELDSEKARNEAIVEQAEAGLKEKEEEARDLAEALDIAKRELVSASARASTLDEDLRNASRAQAETAETQRLALDAVSTDLDNRNSELERLKRDLSGASARIAELEDSLKTASREYEGAAQVHLAGIDEVRRDLESRTTELRQVRQETEVFSERIQQLENDLRVAARSDAESGKLARSLGDELEQAKADLANERRLHREDGEKLLSVISEKEAIEAEFSRSGGRLQETGTALEAERNLRTTAEEQALTARQESERIAGELERVSDAMRKRDNDYSVEIEDLSASLAQALKEQSTLGQQLESVTAEKNRAEEKLAGLTAEIAQARTALADEWEDHMNADEKLAAASKNNLQLQQAQQRLDDLTTELQQARTALADEWEDHMDAQERLEALDRQKQPASAPPADAPQAHANIAVKDTDLPVIIRARSMSLAKVDIPPIHPVNIMEETEGQESPSPAGTVLPQVEEPDLRTAADIPLEDLFEDPVPPISPGTTSPVVQQHDEIAVAVPETGEEGDGLAGEEIGEEEENPEGDERDDETGIYTPGAYSSGISPVSFNRQQWFDLFTWARHADALTTDQRMEIIRMGRLIQRGRKLTQKQDARIREMIDLVMSLGYRIP